MMHTITFRRLVKSDMPMFIKMRIEQLQEEGAEPAFDLSPFLYGYYEKHLNDGTFVSWLAIDGERIVATSGMSFVEEPSYYSNPSGKIGLLSSMYTLKTYRRRGLAKQLLGRVVNEARLYGCGAVHITASNAGVQLYADYGFEKNENFMQYILLV